jgi:hypothetical protein
MYFVVKNARVSWQDSGIQVDPSDAYEIPSVEQQMSINEAFVQAVRTGDRSLLRSPYDDALKTAAVTLAANKSAEEGGRLVRIEELLPADALG